MGAGLLRGRAAIPLAGTACVLLGSTWGATLVPGQAWGWDETMHAQLPAVRMLLHAGRGEWGAALEVLHGCAQYPFGWPLVLALAQGVFGIGEGVARQAGLAAWAATLFLLFLCGRELARVQRPPGAGPGRGEGLLPWLALGLAALAPMPLAFAGTLFLEVPFSACAALALWAWLRRGRPDAGPGADLLAGAALAAACFVKWNYGLLLAAGLGLDALLETLGSARRGGGPRAFARLGRLLAVPALTAFWWLVLPLPLGAATAAEHRGALLGFLGGNLELTPTPYSRRALDAIGWFAISGRMLGLLLVGLVLALGAGWGRELRRPGARALALALLALAGPTLAHPFHLDRFLIPIGPPLWLLAALGLARVLPESPRPRLLALALLALTTLAYPTLEARRLAEATVVALQPAPAQAALREHIARELARRAGLGPGRATPSAGLERAAHEHLGGLVAAAVGPDERPAWLGISSEYSPAALHLDLLARGGSTERFLAWAHLPAYVTFEATDPGWDAERLARWAAEFDVILMTEPPDLRGRAARQFMRRYQELLVAQLGWQTERRGILAIEQPLAAPREVFLYAARPPR